MPIFTVFLSGLDLRVRTTGRVPSTTPIEEPKSFAAPVRRECQSAGALSVWYLRLLTRVEGKRLAISYPIMIRP
jgi:hypothetical protein